MSARMLPVEDEDAALLVAALLWYEREIAAEWKASERGSLDRAELEALRRRCRALLRKLETTAASVTT